MAVVEFGKSNSSKLSSPEVAEKLFAWSKDAGMRGDTLDVTEYTPLEGGDIK